jgi:hypothetical protein
MFDKFRFCGRFLRPWQMTLGGSFNRNTVQISSAIGVIHVILREP